MIDAALPIDRTMAASDRRARSGAIRRLARRLRLGIRMHHLLFLAFTLVAAAPIAGLALWEQRTSYQHELEGVRQRHLLLARNLTATLSGYVRDLQAAFNVMSESGSIDNPAPGLAGLLSALNFLHICVIAPDGTIERSLFGLAPPPANSIGPKMLADLRAIASSAKESQGLSSLQHDPDGHPVFYMVKALPDQRLGIGIISTDYLISLQQSIAFGEHGYVVIIDNTGQVIAHPLKDWVATSRNISDETVVPAMMHGGSDVGQFYSSAFNSNMIAGYAVVPETGWGVMVAQPLAELRQRAGRVAQLAIIVGGVALCGAVFMSWLIALLLARPLYQVAHTAEAVRAGADDVAAPNLSNAVPLEIRQLGLAFDTILDDLRRRNNDASLALRQAESSSLAKMQFLANISHEIRTPLNGVVGMIELLRLSDPSPMQQRYIEGATQSSQNLLRLIDDIMDLSKIEAGKMELEHAPFHLPSLIHDARSLFSDQARAKGLSLSALVAGNLNVALLGDSHRLLQILTNLVSNALKFTSEGTITIGVTCLEEDATSLHLRFTVADSGIGIPASKQEAIFEAFSQADSSTTRRYGGTGLGLSIARQLCHLMGGEIGVDSAVGRGSTFWFTAVLDKQRSARGLPSRVARTDTTPREIPSSDEGAEAASAAQREFQAALGDTGLASISILLVEDNPANLRVTQALLEAIGCIVTPTRNGLEAVSAYRGGVFDLILMDCQMPEMDGYEATRAIRRLESFQDRTTPIVALTAHAMDGSREMSLAAGMNDHLTKPLLLSVLTAKLVEWLGSAAPAQRSPTG